MPSTDILKYIPIIIGLNTIDSKITQKYSQINILSCHELTCWYFKKKKYDVHLLSYNMENNHYEHKSITNYLLGVLKHTLPSQCNVQFRFSHFLNWNVWLQN